MDNFDPALISVVMPCYNAAPYVEEAIECVLRQSYRQVELIVVNDGSHDASAEIIARLADGNPDRISVLHQTNSGPYAARNQGLSHARGNFVAFLDADDYWHPDALRQLHAAMTQTLADVAYCGWQNVGESAVNTQPHIPPDYHRNRCGRRIPAILPVADQWRTDTASAYRHLARIFGTAPHRHGLRFVAAHAHRPTRRGTRAGGTGVLPALPAR